MPGAKQRTTDITAGPGGIMTDEVGVVTGDLTLRSELRGGAYVLMVQRQNFANSDASDVRKAFQQAAVDAMK